MGTIIKIESFAKYEVFIIVGILMTLLSLGKLLGFYNLSSDWFWFLAGLGLIVEGAISHIRQKRFDRKYKVIERKD